MNSHFKRQMLLRYLPPKTRLPSLQSAHSVHEMESHLYLRVVHLMTWVLASAVCSVSFPFARRHFTTANRENFASDSLTTNPRLFSAS